MYVPISRDKCNSESQLCQLKIAQIARMMFIPYFLAKLKPLKPLSLDGNPFKPKVCTGPLYYSAVLLPFNTFRLPKASVVRSGATRSFSNPKNIDCPGTA